MNQVEVKQSSEPIVLDEIVPGSVQQIQDTLIGISAVSGYVLTLAKFRRPTTTPMSQVSTIPGKKRGRKPGGRGPGRPPVVPQQQPSPQPAQQQASA